MTVWAQDDDAATDVSGHVGYGYGLWQGAADAGQVDRAGRPGRQWQR